MICFRMKSIGRTGGCYSAVFKKGIFSEGESPEACGEAGRGMVKGSDGYKTAVRVAGLRPGLRAAGLAPGEPYDKRRGRGLHGFSRFPACGRVASQAKPGQREAGQMRPPPIVGERRSGSRRSGPDRGGAECAGSRRRAQHGPQNPSAEAARTPGRVRLCGFPVLRQTGNAAAKWSRSVKCRAAAPAFYGIGRELSPG